MFFVCHYLKHLMNSSFSKIIFFRSIVGLKMKFYSQKNGEEIIKLCFPTVCANNKFWEEEEKKEVFYLI